MIQLPCPKTLYPRSSTGPPPGRTRLANYQPLLGRFPGHNLGAYKLQVVLLQDKRGVSVKSLTQPSYNGEPQKLVVHHTGYFLAAVSPLSLSTVHYLYQEGHLACSPGARPVFGPHHWSFQTSQTCPIRIALVVKFYGNTNTQATGYLCHIDGHSSLPLHILSTSLFSCS